MRWGWLAGTRAAAREQLGDVPYGDARIVDGPPAPSLLAVLERESATLPAVGTHGGGHLARMLLGSVATSLLIHAGAGMIVIGSRGVPLNLRRRGAPPPRAPACP